MQKAILASVLALVAMFSATAAIAQTRPATEPARAVDATSVRIVIVGDSTVCAYPTTRPDRGWGQFIEERFVAGSVTVVNLAAPGRSSKTFITEGRWKQALDAKPDAILIQFGHNDSHARENAEATDAATDFRDNLRRYIADARAIGATPVLITPMVRRTFDAAGRIVEPIGAGNLLPYVDAMKAVSVERHVPIIDLYATSKALAERLGATESAAFANKPGDVTHFNEKGARAMADLVMEQLPSAVPTLSASLKQP